MSKQVFKRRSRGTTEVIGRINIQPRPGLLEELKQYFEALEKRGDITAYILNEAISKTHYVFMLGYPKGRRGSLKNIMKVLQYIADKYNIVTDMTLFYGVTPREYVFYPRR